ncbi:MAG: Gfo/Idh/MocA family protein [Armatimonadota bacterium]
MAVKIGVMSFAHMHAYGYALALKDIPNGELAGIADDNAERGQNMAQHLGTNLFTSYEAMLDSDVDAVIVTPENIKHREFTEMAARAGKHVLCEKPLATSVEDARAMIDVCEENGVKLMTAFPCRYSPAVIRARDAIKSGAIGDILAIKGTNHGMMPGGWFIDLPMSGGGAVIDHTVHVTDLMRWITGSDPVEVYAEISNKMYHQNYDDIGILTITFDNGVFSTLDSSWSRPRSFPTWGDVTMDIIGTDGVVSVDMTAQNIVLYSDAAMRVQWINWGSNVDLGLVTDFVNSIEQNLPVPITGEDGMKAMEVALAAYRSRDTGAPVKLPL